MPRHHSISSYAFSPSAQHSAADTSGLFYRSFLTVLEAYDLEYSRSFWNILEISGAISFEIKELAWNEFLFSYPTRFLKTVQLTLLEAS